MVVDREDAKTGDTWFRMVHNSMYQVRQSIVVTPSISVKRADNISGHPLSFLPVLLLFLACRCYSASLARLLL